MVQDVFQGLIKRLLSTSAEPNEFDFPPAAPRRQRYAQDALRAPPWPALPLVLLAIVALGDILFWKQVIGVSAVVFCWAVFGGVLMFRQRRNWLKPAGLLAVASLPALEYAQALSISFLVIGLVLAITRFVLPSEAPISALLRATLSALRTAPLIVARDLARSFAPLFLRKPSSGLTGFIKGWAFPLGGALILTSLLAQANPVLAEWLVQLGRINVVWNELILRTMFWIGIGLVTLALLVEPDHTSDVRFVSVHLDLGTWLGLNHTSVFRALVGFNLLLLVQTGLDAMVLFGQGDLPAGITYAEYARRGAYPLLATTMLGGLFALAARPFLHDRKHLQGLLYVWILQNMAMTLAAWYRLALYVDAFGLTYLRVYAMIWIPMVAVGLGLTFWQVLRHRSNVWLLQRSTFVALAVLYVAAFVNIADAIARHNIARTDRIDWAYLLKDLPSTAVPAVLEGAAVHVCLSGVCDLARTSHDPIANWREWGFRRWRVDSRMSALESAEPDG